MIGWLFGWLVIGDWLVGWLVGSLVRWFVDRSSYAVVCPVPTNVSGWLVGWLIVQVYFMVTYMNGWKELSH